MEREKK